MHLAGVQRDSRVEWQSRELVYRVVTRLRQDRRSFFGDLPGDLLGARLSERFQADPAERCEGIIEKAIPIKARGALAAEIFGRAGGASEDEAPSFIALADPRGIIRGLGIFVEAELEDSGSPTCADHEDGPGRRWIGFIGELQRSERYVAYGVVSGGGSVCRLAALRTTSDGRIPRVLFEDLP